MRKLGSLLGLLAATAAYAGDYTVKVTVDGMS
jgi:hypothetical protein